MSFSRASHSRACRTKLIILVANLLSVREPAKEDTLSSISKAAKCYLANTRQKLITSPKNARCGWTGLPDGFFSTSVRDIHAWAHTHRIEDFDVTLFACSQMDTIRFEIRVDPECFNKIREKYGRPGSVTEDWSQKPAMRLIKITEAIAKTTAGIFRFDSKRPRIIFTPEGAHIPFPCTVEQLSDTELQRVQVTLLSFVRSHRGQSGFTASYSMGGWRKTKRAHIKIRFPDSDILEQMRQRAEARQSVFLRH